VKRLEPRRTSSCVRPEESSCPAFDGITAHARLLTLPQGGALLPRGGGPLRSVATWRDGVVAQQLFAGAHSQTADRAKDGQGSLNLPHPPSRALARPHGQSTRARHVAIEVTGSGSAGLRSIWRRRVRRDGHLRIIYAARSAEPQYPATLGNLRTKDGRKPCRALGRLTD
jgi:hypothetical protein